MSIIKADTLPKRGAELTSNDLNEVFTDINDGFPLDGDNARNEAIATPQLDTNANHGKSGIILRYADHYGESHGAGTIVRANEQATHPFDNPQLIQDETVIIPMDDGDILRVYFQIEAEPDGTGSPLSITANDWFWVFWLEWKLSSGGAWETVDNQTDYDDILISPATYGGFTEDSSGAIFVSHATIHLHSGSTRVDQSPRRGHCGNYFLLENTGGRTIYGLRIMGKGLMRGGYVSGGVSQDGNAAFITSSPASTHQCTVYASDISYVVMRNK